MGKKTSQMFGRKNYSAYTLYLNGALLPVLFDTGSAITLPDLPICPILGHDWPTLFPAKKAQKKCSVYLEVKSNAS